MLNAKTVRLFKWIICITFILSSQVGIGISRVGNGLSLQSESANFRVDIPYEFSRFNFFGKNSARLIGLPAMQSNIVARGAESPFFETQFIEIRDFAEEYPELILNNKSFVGKYFIEKGFVRMARDGEGCFEVYAAETQSLHTIIVWNNIGQGYVLIGPKRIQVELAIDKIINSTQLLDRVCH